MEHPRHVSRSLAAALVLVLALFTIGTVRSVGAQENTSLGTGALASNTTGQADTAIGFEALFSNTTGSENTALGYVSLFKNTTGITNTATGDSALTQHHGQ